MSGQITNGVQLLEISEDQSGQRIDNFLLSLLKGVPRS
ncbi:MAG: 23S rRNA pseudouridine(955/2504/2580) synthase, partial [Cellvibrionales bacterium]